MTSSIDFGHSQAHVHAVFSRATPLAINQERTVTPKNPEILAPFAAALVAAALVACQPMATTAPLDLRVERAPLANEGCAVALPVAGLPEVAESVVVQVTVPGAAPYTSPPIEVTPALRAGRSTLVERLPVDPDGEAQRLTLHVCSGGQTTWMGGAAVTLRENAKTPVTLRLKQVNALSCTGGSRSAEQTQVAAPARGRAFALEVPLADGRTFFGAGAAALSGALVSSTPLDADYDVYDPVATVFDPSGDRGSAEVGPRLLAPRIAGTVIVDSADDDAVLVFGGSNEAEWLGGFAFGPLRPNSPPRPFAERLVWRKDVSAPLRTATGEAIEPRMMPSIGTDPVERSSVILGGFAYDASMTPAPSKTLEIVKGGRVFRDTLPTPRVGASVTPLGAERFLVWGGDVGACGGDPGLLIDLKSSQPKQPLAITAQGGLPVCRGDSRSRAWWSTGFHRAARLPDLPDGAQRVIVIGGLEVLEGRLEQTPNIGGDEAGANAIILTLPREVAAGTPGSPFVPDAGAPVPSSSQPRLIVQPLDLAGSPEARAALRRIWHGLSVVDDRVVVSGGWTTPGAATFGEGPTPTKSLVVFRVAPDSQLSRPPDVDPGVRTVEALTVTEMTGPRLGHLSSSAVDGAVVFAGGITGEPGAQTLSTSAELWQAPPSVDPCVGVVAPATMSDATLALPEASLPPVPGDDAALDAAGLADAALDAQSVQ